MDADGGCVAAEVCFLPSATSEKVQAKTLQAGPPAMQRKLFRSSLLWRFCDRSKRSKCKRLAAVLDKAGGFGCGCPSRVACAVLNFSQVFDGDPDYFQSMVEELSAQGRTM